MGSEGQSIPKIDFSGLAPGTTAGWDNVQSEVIKALETFGCFEALYDGVTPEAREVLFGRAIPDLFSLPVEVKKRKEESSSQADRYLHYYPYESLGFSEGDVPGFTHLMWPQGNPSFCDTVSAYAKHLKELEQMIMLMICRSLGVEEYYESQIQSATYDVRLNEYEVPFDQGTAIALAAHFDPNFISILCQHKVEGLEVQTREGEWIHAVPSPNSFTVLLGQAFEGWSNGRLSPTLHRVRLVGNEKRNSVHFGSSPKAGYIVQAPKELVDEEHPLRYMPYRFKDHLKFLLSSGDGTKSLKDFCGVRE